MTKTIFVTGVTDAFGVVIAHALADAGHTVYVGIGQEAEWSASVPAGKFPDAGVRRPGLRTVALETIDQRSVNAAVREIDAEAGRIDVVIHPSGPVAVGPAESFTPFQLSQFYDLSVLSAQRVNRAVLPLMRRRGDGLLIWTGLPAGPGPDPFLAPGRAVRAAQDHLARSYAAELAPFGIDVTVISYGMRHAGSSGASAMTRPDDIETAASYEQLMKDQVERAEERLAFPPADGVAVGRAVVDVVDTPKGQRPFHVTVADGLPTEA